jgi:elongator complex protein 4
MSFRRYAPSKPPSISTSGAVPVQKLPTGVKPASTPTISTGTSTLDPLLSPSSGLPLASGLLVEEDGTGNYSGVILRQYVAQGIVHGDKVWIGGVGDGWWRGIPGLSKQDKHAKPNDAIKQVEEKMKIAWRYGINDPKSPKVEANMESTLGDFCHAFDISEQMPFPGKTQVTFSPPPAPSNDPFQPLLTSLFSFLDTTPKTTPIRLVLPDFLNPLIYGPQSTNPSSVLKFIHILLTIINAHTYSTLLLSISTSFYPRTQPLTSWIEHLCIHVIQLRPLPRVATAVKQPQGLVSIHKGGLMSKEMAYRVGRRGMVYEEWSLPPLEEEAPRVKQGFVIDKDFTSTGVGTSHVSGVASKDLEF